MGQPLRLALPASLVFFCGLAAGVAAAQPDQHPDARLSAERVTQLAAATTGTIAGQVLDERGQPLSDVVVSAVGGSTSIAVTDQAGQFTLSLLLPGPYMVRAHLEGYTSARHTIITVRPSVRTASTFTLRRSGSASEARIIAAGSSAVDDEATASSAPSDSEIAWRLRRLKRSILKEETATLAGMPADEDWFITDSLQLLGRAFESSARMAGALFTSSPLQGQVNLLTTGAFDRPGQLLQQERVRGVAFFAVGAPVGRHGDWKVKAALNQGDLSAWLLAGDYVVRAPARHQYQVGMSYGLHRYEGGNPVALAAIRDTARNVGAVYAYDRWAVTERLSLGYGGHYARYDYLAEPAHFSPRLSATIRATDRVQLRAVASRRVTAPGAEEFLPPARTEVLPPQRTFAPLTRAGFVPEDMRHYEVTLERVLDRAVFGVRTFHQSTDNQLVTVFGLGSESTIPVDVGHYFVGSAGHVDVRGWGVTLSHGLADNVRGSFDYSMADAHWANVRSADRVRLAQSTPSALRAANERVHDFTTTLETELPQSSTRLFLLYKLNTGYIRPSGAAAEPGLDGRWDLQVNQRLPFMNFSSAEWEMLVAVRNLFRESLVEASIYDELLVARPPKRLVGGITVKF